MGYISLEKVFACVCLFDFSYKGNLFDLNASLPHVSHCLFILILGRKK